MSQQDCIKILQKYPNKWFTAKEISDKLKISSGSVAGNLKSCYQHKEVKRKDIYKPKYVWSTVTKGGYLWQIK